MTDTSLAQRCDEIISKYSLLEHPFYQAWSNGTLPVEALKSYASEYGAFIGSVGLGWETLGEKAIAKHEAAHARIWADSFAGELGTAVGEPAISEVKELVDTARGLFADDTEAIGALYSFEVQQPRTAESKLKGLSDHYKMLPERSGDYFRLHSGDYDEVSLLSARMDGTVDAERVAGSCERMSKALYDALTGIYEPYAPASTATC